jgi:hypothetical protein
MGMKRRIAPVLASASSATQVLVGLQRVFILLLSMTIMTALAALTAARVEAQQVADNTYNPPIENPAFPQNSGPVVAIDGRGPFQFPYHGGTLQAIWDTTAA